MTIYELYVCITITLIPLISLLLQPKFDMSHTQNNMNN